MIKENLSLSEVRKIIISETDEGQPEKVVFLIKLSDEKATLVIPEGVRVRPVPFGEEMAKIEEAKRRGEFDEETFWAGAATDKTLVIKKGKFLAKDAKTGRTVGFEFNPNSHCLGKKAA